MRTLRPLLWRLRFLSISLACVLLSGCLHLAPISREGDRDEAITFARLLRSFVPELTDLLHDEQIGANDMKILFDESSGKDFNTYRDKFDAMVQRFVVIRNKRLQIQMKLRQRSWRGALSHLIQLDSIDEIEQGLERSVAWIQLAHNFRLRADFGRLKDFPELSLLSQSLESFLSEAQDEPLSSQISSLRAEYRFKESDLGPI